MLQRIQTVWMGLAVVAAIFLYITSTDVVFVESSIPIISMVSLALAAIGFLSILSFKNRPRQILLNKISIIINVLLIGALTYWLLNLSGGIDFPEKGIELLFPIISIIALLIANVYIRKDDKLVKSVDRLR